MGMQKKKKKKQKKKKQKKSGKQRKRRLKGKKECGKGKRGMRLTSVAYHDDVCCMVYFLEPFQIPPLPGNLEQCARDWKMSPGNRP